MSWEKCTLADIVTIKKGEYITKKDAVSGNYPVILGGKEPAYYINKYNHVGKAIVISRSGASAGYVSFWNEPIFITDGFLIEPKQNTTHKFLFYLLKSKQSELSGIQRGAAIPHVTPSLINSINISLPDLHMQNRIASILSAYDDLIENNQKQIKLLEEAAQRLYKEWFVDLRFPGWENTKIVDGVPEGWHIGLLSELISVNYGKDHKKVPNTGDIPVYGSGGIMRKCNKSLYSGESVLIPRKGSLNNIMYVNESFWTVDTMFFTIPQKPHSAIFTYFFVSGIDMYSFNIGAAVPSMTVKILDNLSLVIPDSSFFEKFDMFVQPYFKKIKLLRMENGSLITCRNNLLFHLFRSEHT